MDELDDFQRQFRSDILGGADAHGIIVVESFFDRVSELLQEAGETESGTRAYYEGRFEKKRLRVDGYGGDPNDADGVLCLILCEYFSEETVRTIGAVDIKPLFAMLTDFLRASRSLVFREGLEEASAGFGLADMIATRWPSITKIKLILLTNADSRAKADAFPAGAIDEKPITYNLWDLKRIRKFVEQGLSREDLKIDFLADFGAGIPILRASGGEAALDSYLAVIPGKQLAAIYDKWGARLLEANVRAFLQTKGGVNQGIRKTILEEPHMFLSYNNGIAATADAILVRQTEHGLEMVAADNLQIVNGGQTTASIHAARKLAGDKLNDIFVQMKLSVVPPERYEEVVPRISEYANSQNKVSAADFFANHPFHIKVQEMSRRILAPAGERGYMETKWFYERARGQYADERSKLTVAQQKRFDASYPRPQFFTKTDLAKYENSFQCRPHIVSLGAQKNFGDFAKSMETRWGAEGAAITDSWFRRIVAKTIIFKSLEPLVSAALWYEGGYRANIVTYAIAKVVHDALKRDKVIDFDRIWKVQVLPVELADALLVAAAKAQFVILNPVGSVRNLGEWAKKPACWKNLSDLSLSYDDGLNNVLIDIEEQRRRDRDERGDTEVDLGIANQTRVVSLGGTFWKYLLKFGSEKRALTEKEAQILKLCGDFPSKFPSEQQCSKAIKILEKLERLGFEATVPT